MGISEHKGLPGDGTSQRFLRWKRHTGREGFFLKPAIKWADNEYAELILIPLGVLSYKQFNLIGTKITIC
jgi:hypothetical protein